MIWHPSPNFGDRRGGAVPDIVVLHYTAMARADAARDWLCDPASEVSAHYVIARDGTCWQLVDEAKRAWHAGAGAWADVTDVNSRSIGVELANTGSEPFPEPQMAALEDLLEKVMERWAIPPARVIGHSDMAPGRKIDPGPRFDWLRLERHGLAGQRGRDPGPRDPSPEVFRKLAERHGYTAAASAEAILHAVRLRYRHGEQGPICAEDYSPIGHAALWT